ncbi:MAG: hypothetical protein HOO91_01030 [Bacteroidales bacterium]|nr:hypothetical protein [Bacteroidales bacterium]
MKKKNSFKNLSLSKETISNLSKNQASKIIGGETGLENCTTQQVSCCYPQHTCQSGAVKTGALSGCAVCH